MSYIKKLEYKIVPIGTFKIIGNCAGCGGKATFVNTSCFRVNANGNMLDVWLIYQCQKCRHTLNLPIYERKKASAIPKEEYLKFLENDALLAEKYGQKKEFFVQNKMEIAWNETAYKYVDFHGNELIQKHSYESGDMICIRNEYGIKVRPERMAADIFGCSRSGIKRMVDKGEILIEVGQGTVEIWCLKDIEY